MAAHGEVFGAPMMDPKTLEKMGVRLEYALDDDGELVYRIAGGLTYAQARELVAYVNSEGNYDEFVFRPAWPDEV